MPRNSSRSARSRSDLACGGASSRSKGWQLPLIIQLVLFYNFAPIIGLNLNPFLSGVVILSIYCAALVANVARGGMEAVETTMRRAARSLGMTYFQDLRYVVLPIGGRAVFPSWVGVALGVMKDSALVSVLGYIELRGGRENSDQLLR